MNDDHPATTGTGTGTGPEKELAFEEMLDRLETLVTKLESGDLRLEQSLALYEEGVRLASGGTRVLETAQQRIEVLLEDGTRRPLEIEVDQQ